MNEHSSEFTDYWKSLKKSPPFNQETANRLAQLESIIIQMKHSHEERRQAVSAAELRAVRKELDEISSQFRVWLNSIQHRPQVAESNKRTNDFGVKSDTYSEGETGANQSAVRLESCSHFDQENATVQIPRIVKVFICILASKEDREALKGDLCQRQAQLARLGLPPQDIWFDYACELASLFCSFLFRVGVSSLKWLGAIAVAEGVKVLIGKLLK